MTLPATIANQITPNGVQPYVNQQNFGQVTGEVMSWNTAAGPSMVQNWINDAARDYYDHRLWYGLMTKGQLVCPGFYQAGSVQLTFGSPTVIGTGTAWTASMIGQQFRAGFTSPIFTIINVNVATQVLTLELPWGNPSLSSTGYFITQYYYSIPNVKYIYSMKNLQLMYRMCTNVPQSLIENIDPTRMVMMFPRALVTMPPDPSGNYQVELWPVPNTQQSLPYLAYVQPPNLVNDDDNFIPYMRCDVIKARAIAKALMYKPKSNPDYSEATCLQLAKTHMAEYQDGLASAAQADEQLFRQDVVRWGEQLPYIDLQSGSWGAGGAMLAAMTAVSIEDY